MPKIETLVPDIYRLFQQEVRFEEGTVRELGTSLGDILVRRLSEKRQNDYLRLSNLGTPCRRKLWYSVRSPQLSEPLSAATRIKFLFGDILEQLLLFLARAAGHTVTDEQKEVSVAGVKGHIDGLIDGELVDCKSASTYSFDKFKSHSLGDNDPFGYLTQLGSYGSALNSKRNHFLAIDKTLGHITLDTWEQPDVDYTKMVEDSRVMLAKDYPPDRGYEDVPDGKSGNRKLGVTCSYCSFKNVCWRGLRQFNYARGPVYLTVVNREPRVDAV